MTSSNHRVPARKPGRLGGFIRITASYLVAGICLFWVFHDIDFAQMARSLAHLNWWLLAVCMGLQLLAYGCVAWKWQLLLQPVGRLPLRRAVQAVFAGRFANDALPFQLGYLVRVGLAARWMNVKMISIFPSLIVERLWDGVWLATGIGLVTLLLPLPPDVLHAADLLGGIVLFGVATTVLVVVRRSRKVAGHAAPTTFKWKPLQLIQRIINQLVDGLREISRPDLLAIVCVLSLLMLLIQGTAFLGLLRAYGLQFPMAVGLAVFLMGYLGICIPSTPAGTGMFQLFVVTGLRLFGVSKSVAAGFALTAFLAMTLPLAIAGFFAFAQSGLRLRQVQRLADNWKNLEQT